MVEKPIRITEEQCREQEEICLRIRERLSLLPEQPLAFVDTYGCQQNEADSEHIRGYLSEMGYDFTEDENAADVIVINTCAVREHAEDRVFGNIGALVHTKRRHPGQIICVCGCMAAESGVAEKIKKSYRHVDLVFAPHALWQFPSLLWRVMERRGRIFCTDAGAGTLAEGLPTRRQNPLKSWISVMYGCNNFCSYCIVPYVRGRERSRAKDDILAEAHSCIEGGSKELTLLGQNVNSYGRDTADGTDFADLLREINAIPGDFLIRFMTSHPKDASDKLFRTMAECEKAAPVLHLPFQCGNNRVLAAMNRGYTREEYLEKVRLLRTYIPDVVLTSDVIVGFPGETTAEFEDTLSLIEEVRFDALFTFIFSPRDGTPAARMEDPIPPEEKKANFERLCTAQDRISAEKHAAYKGKTVRCLIDGFKDGCLTARTPGNRLVRIRDGNRERIGGYAPVRIEDANTWSLTGSLV